MDRIKFKIRLTPLEEMIEENFKLNEKEIDLNYLGRLLDEYKDIKGNVSKYQQEFIQKLQI